MEEDGSIVFTDLLSLPDVLDGLDHDIVLHVVPDDAGVARVVEQGQGGIDTSTNEHRLGALLARFAGLKIHIELYCVNQDSFQFFFKIYQNQRTRRYFSCC